MLLLRAHIATRCNPQQRNTAGRIFGGFLMRRAFELAHATAYRFCGQPPSIVEVDEGEEFVVLGLRSARHTPTTTHMHTPASTCPHTHTYPTRCCSSNRSVGKHCCTIQAQTSTKKESNTLSTNKSSTIIHYRSCYADTRALFILHVLYALFLIQNHITATPTTATITCSQSTLKHPSRSATC